MKRSFYSLNKFYFALIMMNANPFTRTESRYSYYCDFVVCLTDYFYRARECLTSYLCFL